MEQFFKAIEENIRKSGYSGEVSYLFLKKQNDDIMFEYRVDILDDNINLATLTIHTPDKKYFIDFDADK